MDMHRLAGLALLPLVLAGCQSAPPTAPPWVADLGDGRYRNLVLHADYSDPDAVGVGDTYYMTASSFNAAPGLPLLRSKDLVNWDGWQAVFRARSIDGPYEVRTVMDQGNTPINGPHQGAWVRALDGRDWFLHFQDKGAHGRVVHLQPMRWEDGWPLIGEPGPRAGTGQPVLTHAKPVAGMPVRVPATFDEFAGPALGLQWQWNANPQPDWHSLAERRGYLRLRTQGLAAGAPLRTAPSILAQKLPAPGFVVDTHVELVDAREGDRAGLILNGLQYAWLGLRRRAGATELVYTTCVQPAAACGEQPQVVLARAPAALWLRISMEEGARARFSFSTDKVHFTPVGEPFVASKGRWVGAQIGLFSVGTNHGSAASNLDVDYFRIGLAAAHAGK